MKISFVTAGLFADCLPAGAKNNQAEISVKDGATPLDVLKQLDLPVDDFYLVILNDQVVPKAERGNTVLRQGDELGIFPPLKGG